jgi:hypothetical protein
MQGPLWTNVVIVIRKYGIALIMVDSTIRCLIDGTPLIVIVFAPLIPRWTLMPTRIISRSITRTVFRSIVLTASGVGEGSRTQLSWFCRPDPALLSPTFRPLAFDLRLVQPETLNQSYYTDRLAKSQVALHLLNEKLHTSHDRDDTQ